MAETINTITDRAQFEELFKKYFNQRDIYIRTKNGDMVVQFLGFNEGNVAFRIPHVKNVPDIIIVFARHDDNTIYASLKVIDKNEDTFIFLPVKFQLVSEKRKEERTELTDGQGKNVIFITNLVSDLMINNSLESNEKKVTLVKEKIIHDLKSKFEKIRVVFINETRIDARMKHFQEIWVPVFIKDMSKPPAEAEKTDFNTYINEIYSKDFKLSSQKEFISEITVPFIYRNLISYGYIQVNNTSPMNEDHLTTIKRLAIMINDFFVKANLLTPGTDKFIVNDMSKSGLGIVFKDRRLLKYFMKDSRVILEMILPNSNKATMMAIVRNTIFNDSGIIKVGMEITNIDAISEVNYDDYLETMK